MIGKPTGY